MFFLPFCNSNIWTHGIEMESWYRRWLMVLTKPHSIDKASWYRQGLMVFTTPMVLILTHGMVSVLLNLTRTKGPSVARVRDFFHFFVTLHTLSEPHTHMDMATLWLNWPIGANSVNMLEAPLATPAGEKSIGATFHIGREIRCLLYAGFVIKFFLSFFFY